MLLLTIVAAVGLAGCGSLEMKGTPFYTGDYKKPQGPPEDRVNLWPLLYYHEPALSVLWPIGEKTEEHFAIRPVFSIYNLDQANRIYNILWPFGQLDYQTENYRFFPVFWGRESGDRNYFVVFPLYWHSGNPYGGDRVGTDGVFPLWIYDRTNEGHYTLSMLFPFVWFTKDGDERGSYVWPLFGNYTGKDDFHWYALWPLIHQWKYSSESGHCVLPLWCSLTKANGDSLFLSLPWSSGRTGQKNEAASWQLIPLLYFHSKTPNTDALITPLWGQGSSDKGKTNWHTLIPFYFYQKAADSRVFATLLGGTMKDANGRSWLIYPLLSGGRQDAKTGNIWILAPLIHTQWDDSFSTHHVLPFYYWNSRDTFVSPIIARWTSDSGEKTNLIVPLLFWWTTTKEGGDLWLLGPLAHFSLREEAGPHHVFPLYYSNPGKSFYTPLFGWNNSPDGFVYPLTPLAGAYRGDASGFWLFPLASYRRDNKTQDYDGFLPFILGRYWKEGRRNGSWFFPLYWYKNNGPIDTVPPPDSRAEEYGKHFFCAPICWYDNKCVVSKNDDGTLAKRYATEHGVCPLWSYSHHERPAAGTMRENSRFLLCLYDYRHRVSPVKDKPGEHDDYVRSRVLWRVWHYEKLNGNVSVDVFPAIAYDSKTSGYGKFSFCWRLFSYEADPAKGKTMHLLFIPFHWARPAATTQGNALGKRFTPP